MGESSSRNLKKPDRTVELPHMHVDQVSVGDLTVGLVVLQPGWRWYDHVRPQMGGELCEVRHVGVVLSGRFGVTLRDGSTHEYGPWDVFEVPAGHDGYTIGDQECVQIDWSGLRAFDPARLMGSPNAVLATLLFTDIVESTSTARTVGDGVWREVLSNHFEAARIELEKNSGREINTTGDGMLATFDGPAAALRGAAGIRRAAAKEGLHIRASVHIGEVEVVGTDVRGIAVHEAARIMGAAETDEILVSATTRALAESSGLRFESRGAHELKGLSGTWELFAFIE